MREIILDTETTGLDPLKGDRIIEIGCVEVVNYIPTGIVFQSYLNPQCDVPHAITLITGLTSDFLQDKPLFKNVMPDFLNFIGTSPLIIHNARFDMSFLNAELARLKHPGLNNHLVVDTLSMARSLFPGSPASLDALCKRFEIDGTHRTHHGALLDAKLLAEVYLHLRGGRQISLSLSNGNENASLNSQDRQYRPSRSHPPLLNEEIIQHHTFIESLPNALFCKWLNTL